MICIQPHAYCLYTCTLYMYCISHVLTHLQPASKSLIYVLNIIYAAVAIRESYPSKGPQHQVVSGPYLSVCLGGFLDARTTHRVLLEPSVTGPVPTLVVSGGRGNETQRNDRTTLCRIHALKAGTKYRPSTKRSAGLYRSRNFLLR